MLNVKSFLVLSCDDDFIIPKSSPVVCCTQHLVSGDSGRQEAGAGSQAECCGMEKGRELKDKGLVRGKMELKS